MYGDQVPLQMMLHAEHPATEVASRLAHVLLHVHLEGGSGAVAVWTEDAEEQGPWLRVAGC